MNYNYDPTTTATGEVLLSKIESEIEESSIENTLSLVYKENGVLHINFTTSLSVEDKNTLDNIVTNHQHITTAESLAIYLDSQVFPFIKELINRFAAENIAMGITQAGKTSGVLGLFEKQYNIGATHPVSLKAAFDTGSLYVALDVLQHIRDNPTEFTNMSPFITDARLLQMKNEIETFLGAPLSS